jgi:GT2 family glycosyltransferase
MEKWDPDQIRQVGVLKGACIILSRRALDEVGLMDEEYFMYTEEVDLCYRLHKQGWPLYWVPQSKVIHYGGQSVHQATTDMFLCLYQTKIYYFRKHYGAAAGLIFKLILALVILPRVLVSFLPGPKGAPEQNRYMNLAWNYRRLLRLLPGM